MFYLFIVNTRDSLFRDIQCKNVLKRMRTLRNVSYICNHVGVIKLIVMQCLTTNTSDKHHRAQPTTMVWK